MPNGDTVTVFYNGQLGDIPAGNWEAARRTGNYEMAQPVFDPSGKEGYVPASRWADAQKAGYKTRDEGPPESQGSRFWGAYKQGLGTGLIAPVQTEAEKAAERYGGPLGPAAYRLVKGAVDTAAQVPGALQYYAQRIPGAQGPWVPAQPLGQTGQELKTISAEVPGLVAGLGTTAALTEGVSQGLPAWRQGFYDARIANAAENVHSSLTNALKPGRTNQNWMPAVKASVESGDLAAAVQDAKVPDVVTGKPTADPLIVKTPTDLYNAIHQRQAAFWQSQVQPRLDLISKNYMDKGAISDALAEPQGISAKIQPKLYKSAGAEERAFYADPDTPMTFAEGQERVADLNQRLDGFFKDPKSSGDVEATAPKIANILKERGAINKQINGAVENLTGEGISDLKARWSNMKTIEDQAFAAKIAEETKRNPNLMAKVNSYLVGKAPIIGAALITGHPVGAALYAGAEFGARSILARLSSPEYHIGKAVDILSKLPKAENVQLAMPRAPVAVPSGELPLTGMGGTTQEPSMEPGFSLRPRFQGPGQGPISFGR